MISNRTAFLSVLAAAAAGAFGGYKAGTFQEAPSHRALMTAMREENFAKTNRLHATREAIAATIEQNGGACAGDVLPVVAEYKTRQGTPGTFEGLGIVAHVANGTVALRFNGAITEEGKSFVPDETRAMFLRGNERNNCVRPI